MWLRSWTELRMEVELVAVERSWFVFEVDGHAQKSSGETWLINVIYKVEHNWIAWRVSFGCPAKSESCQQFPPWNTVDISRIWSKLCGSQPSRAAGVNLGKSYEGLPTQHAVCSNRNSMTSLKIVWFFQNWLRTARMPVRLCRTKFRRIRVLTSGCARCQWRKTELHAIRDSRCENSCRWCGAIVLDRWLISLLYFKSSG